MNLDHKFSSLGDSGPLPAQPTASLSPRPIPSSPCPHPPAAVDCPSSSVGTNVPAGDCVADVGYSAVITASQVAPFFSIDGATGSGPENTVEHTGRSYKVSKSMMKLISLFIKWVS